MLRSFVHHVGLCCMMLAYVASSLKPLKPKGTVGIVIMSDNTLVKFITVWPWHHDEPALSIYIIQS